MSNPHSEHILIYPPKFSAKKIFAEGARRAFLVPYATPSPPSRRSTSYRGTTGELWSTCSPVAFNDIKHLAAACLNLEGLSHPDTAARLSYAFSRRISKRLASKVDRPTAPQSPAFCQYFHMRGPSLLWR